MTRRNIHAVVYGYKSSNLPAAVAAIYDNASPSAVISVVVHDQHPLNRASKMPTRDSLEYNHVFWDHQYTPINYKKKEGVSTNEDYFLSISGDITLGKDWDEELIKAIDGREHVAISGMGKANVSIEGKYFIKNSPTESDSFTISNYIDRNMMFGPSRVFNITRFPTYMKYFGEEEMISLDLFFKGIPIYSCPSGYYSDNNERSIEKLYVPFSIEHHYNSFIDFINDAEDEQDSVERFFIFHGIDYKKIKKIPYQIDDVLYDPNTLQIVDIGGERFIDSVNAIY
tara:strand:- start:1917 stop:2768 length:852 start_codon:yes stop_codon:yes gene_type:complete